MNDEEKFMWSRAFEKIDKIDDKVNKLCLTTAATKDKLDTHLDEKTKEGKRKERAFYVVIAAMASVFSLFTFLRSGSN